MCLHTVGLCSFQYVRVCVGVGGGGGGSEWEGHREKGVGFE